MGLRSESKPGRGTVRERAAGPLVLPAELRARLEATAPGDPLESPQACRAALAAAALCDPAAPAVTLELYGGLRLRAGCRLLPMHAASVAEALTVLQAALPNVRRILPAAGDLTAHYRFSLNGTTVTADLAHPLAAGDHLIIFSASVGG